MNNIITEEQTIQNKILRSKISTLSWGAKRKSILIETGIL